MRWSYVWGYVSTAYAAGAAHAVAGVPPVAGSTRATLPSDWQTWSEHTVVQPLDRVPSLPDCRVVTFAEDQTATLSLTDDLDSLGRREQLFMT